jgi:hypothetical protein
MVRRNASEKDLLAMAVVLERLADGLRQMALGQNEGEPDRGPPRGQDEVKVGQRVRITIRDKYYGRYGTIVSPHGTQFWDVRLDPHDGGVTQVIYKKATSFVAVD